MRVLVATVVHTPLDARIHHRQIRALRRAGVEVTYLAPWDATGTSGQEAAEGVVAVDLPRAVGRRRLSALLQARKAILSRAPRHDLVLLHDPELVLAVVGRLGGLPPVVLDVHEDLGGSLGDRSWVPAPLRPLAARGAAALERWAERHLELLLAEESYRHRFEHGHTVVPNLPWLPLEPPPAGSRHRVVYVGRLSRGRGVDQLLGVAEALHGVGPEGGRERGHGVLLEVHLVGPADEDVLPAVRSAHERGILTWHGFLPNAEALEVVRGAVAGLSLLHDLPNYRGSMPTKLLEYLAHGIPAVTTPLPEAVRLVRMADAGNVVPYADVDATVAAVRGLAGDLERCRRLGANGRAYVTANASWDAAADDFVAALRSMARRGGA